MSETKAGSPTLEKKEISVSERFTQKVLDEFKNIAGNGIVLTPDKKILISHLFISIDTALKKAEIDRQFSDKKRPPVIWANVNLQKLAKDAIHRINLGLDSFIQNHIQIVPYFSEKEEKYDVSLSIGYEGKNYYRKQLALDPPKDIRYELVHENDIFKPIKKDVKHEIETYEFSTPKPFDRGEIVGGFGYIIYEDPTKNRLITLTEKEFKKSEECAPSKKFWKAWPDRQRYKTIVHRTTEKIPPDPKKINESYMIVETQDAEESILQQIEDNANKEIIDIEENLSEIPKEIPSETEKDPKKAEPGNPRKPQNSGPDF